MTGQPMGRLPKRGSWHRTASVTQKGKRGFFWVWTKSFRSWGGC